MWVLRGRRLQLLGTLIPSCPRLPPEHLAGASVSGRREDVSPSPVSPQPLPWSPQPWAPGGCVDVSAPALPPGPPSAVDTTCSWWREAVCAYCGAVTGAGDGVNGAPRFTALQSLRGAAWVLGFTTPLPRGGALSPGLCCGVRRHAPLRVPQPPGPCPSWLGQTHHFLSRLRKLPRAGIFLGQ